jgi:hypothetical protein
MGEYMNTTIRLYGEIEGPIWMPSEVCSREFDVRLERIPRNSTTRTAHAHGWPMQVTCLRDALLTITNDGDFQNASITYAVLVVSHRKGSKTISRTWELKGKGENADCFAQVNQ